MKMPNAAGTSRGVGQLLREVAEDGAHLARQEVHLARIEFAQIARDIGKGTGFAVAAGMLGVLTVQMLVFGIVLLLGDALFRGHYWIAAFVLTAILGGGAFWLLKRGTALLSPKNLKPEQTLATLRRHNHD
ncbi:MAG TPA: phage holin family protein [Gemmatimonadaceae bacterium]|nr:phage holin family protein [Gemmatimonadaceae bacterium]